MAERTEHHTGKPDLGDRVDEILGAIDAACANLKKQNTTEAASELDDLADEIFQVPLFEGDHDAVPDAPQYGADDPTEPAIERVDEMDTPDASISDAEIADASNNLEAELAQSQVGERDPIETSDLDPDLIQSIAEDLDGVEVMLSQVAEQIEAEEANTETPADSDALDTEQEPSAVADLLERVVVPTGETEIDDFAVGLNDAQVESVASDEDGIDAEDSIDLAADETTEADIAALATEFDKSDDSTVDEVDEVDEVDADLTDAIASELESLDDEPETDLKKETDFETLESKQVEEFDEAEDLRQDDHADPDDEAADQSRDEDDEDIESILAEAVATEQPAGESAEFIEPSSQTDSLAQLDEELAGLADSLVDGEFEDAQGDVSAVNLPDLPPQPSDDELTEPDNPGDTAAAIDEESIVVEETEDQAPADGGNEANNRPSTASTPTVEPKSAKGKKTVVARALMIVQSTGSAVAPAGAAALLVIAKPTSKLPTTTRDTIGWLGLYTGFLSICVWGFLLMFRQPATPAPTQESIGLVDEQASESATMKE